VQHGEPKVGGWDISHMSLQHGVITGSRSSSSSTDWMPEAMYAMLGEKRALQHGEPKVRGWDISYMFV
jgi:hypothetical protein